MKLFLNRSHLLDFHRPRNLKLDRPLKAESIACLRSLASYKRPKSRGRYPRSRSAAVLVALFVGRGGDLYVLLSRRSDELRSYPGDTSLPGGKLERTDQSLENAARREAFEEASEIHTSDLVTTGLRTCKIGLPLDKTKVPLLCILEPFLAGNHIIVTPVVVLILDQTLRPILNAFEVQSLFSHPLLAFLETSPSRESEAPIPDRHLSSRTEKGTPSNNHSPVTIASGVGKLRSKSTRSTYALKPLEQPYRVHEDILWHGRPVRMHRFLTGREAQGVKPIFGLTSAILIRTAQIGYARDPEYELCAPGQASLEDRIAIAMQQQETLRKACRDEGIERDWNIPPDKQRLTTKARGRL
ncbi:hypothetical protein JB92DRAFT_340107 [Gautieria morchelliformis]|nr:hypothetical protein JB92DRAFT_340107 [Gautieria morchelliformis]